MRIRKTGLLKLLEYILGAPVFGFRTRKASTGYPVVHHSHIAQGPAVYGTSFFIEINNDIFVIVLVKKSGFHSDTYDGDEYDPCNNKSDYFLVLENIFYDLFLHHMDRKSFFGYL